MIDILLATSWGTPNHCGIAWEQLASRIKVLPSGCWRWTGTIGYWDYGQIGHKGKIYRAHRVVYIAIKGPTALPLDHLCRRKWCVNPDHLEPVSNRTNVLRGHGVAARNAKKICCQRGHRLSGENLRLKRGRYGFLRTCRQCACADAKRRARLFWRIHAPTARQQHWRTRKQNNGCRDCAQYLAEVRHVS